MSRLSGRPARGRLRDRFATRRRRRTTLARRIALVTTAVVVVAILIAGLISLGLVRTAAQNEGRRSLARQADMVAALLDAGASVRPRKPMAVLREQGTPVALLGPGNVLRGDSLAKKAIAPRRSELANGRSLSFQTSVSGRQILVEARPLSRGGGLVLARTSSQANAVAYSLLREQLVALLIGLGVAVAAGLLLARWLSAPLTRAASAARALGGGNRSVRVSPEGPVEVAAVAESLNTLATALALSENRQREFLLSVSHELRTPLTTIKGFAESLADGVTTGAQVPATGRTILAESAQLERLVTDLLDLARLGADDFRVDLLQIDLTAVLSDAARSWSARSAEAGVIWRAHLPATPVPIVTDPGRIRQIVDGLTENALRVTPAERPIVLELRRPGTDVVIEVRDGGPGLTAEDRKVAFERSVLHQRYRGIRKVGTGVGLALVHGLVVRLGGTIVVDCAPEGGACFRITFPADPGA